MKLIKQCNNFKLEQLRKSFILTWSRACGEDSHLLSPTLVGSFKDYLKEVKSLSKATPGSVLITTAEGGASCKGFDCNQEINDGFKDVVKDLISLPMPTIAAINGYATEAGLVLALSHDHLTMKQQVEGQGPPAGLWSGKRCYPAYFTALIRSKVGLPLHRRELLLRDKQIGAREAADFGLLDWNHEVGEDALKVAEARAEAMSNKEYNGELYAEMRKALYPELWKELESKN